MIPLGLSAADWRTLRSTLVSPHRMRVRVSALTLGGDYNADLSPYLVDGQVDVDDTAQITRVASLVLLDPKRALPFDTDHPADTALFMDRMVRVSYQVLVGSDWQPMPAFTGPVTGLNRDGDLVNVSCSGKEVLFLGAAWRAGFTLHKGMKKTDAIVRILTEGNPAYAESRLDIPDLGNRLPKHISLTRESVLWLVARQIAHSMGRQLFYDGRGRARLRHRPNLVGLSFTGGRYVTGPLKITYSSGVVNAVEVIGAVPKGAKRPVQATAVAPANHPLSPQRIGRYLLPDGKIIRDDSIKTTAEAQDVAAKRLADGLRQSVDVQFESVPGVGAFLEPGDLCHVDTDDGSVTFRLSKFSLPLVADDSNAMTVGYHRETPLRHTRRHHHHARHHR